jgi:hypothetical protein
MGPFHRRSGSALLWSIALISVLALIAAIAAPYLSDIGGLERVGTTATMLREVASGVDSFNLTAKRGSSAFTTPNNLAQLTATIANGGTSGCTAQTYNATAVTNWTSGAPYTSFWMPSDGLWTPIGRLNNLPSRVTTAQATARTANSDPYYIQIPNVDIKDARMLDLLIDGALNGAADTVLYTAPGADSTVLLSYNVIPAHMPAC